MFMCVHNTSLDRTKRPDKHAEEQVPGLAWMHTCNCNQTSFHACHTHTNQTEQSVDTRMHTDANTNTYARIVQRCGGVGGKPAVPRRVHGVMVITTAPPLGR